MRTLVIAVVVLALLVAAFLCHHPTPVKVPGGPDAAVAVAEDHGVDWSAILSIIAGALTALEVAIRTIMQLLAKRKTTPQEAPDAATQEPATPKPPDG